MFEVKLPAHMAMSNQPRYGINFVRGVGYTNDERLARRLKNEKNMEVRKIDDTKKGNKKTAGEIT